jgi:peptide/nickel transport system permease protein
MIESSGSSSPVEAGGVSEIPPKSSEFRRVLKVFFGRPLPTIGLVILVLLILTAIFAPLLAPYDPDKMDMPNKLRSPSAQHLLGTDSLGRDTLSRVIYGSRISLFIGIVAACTSALIGISLGLAAAYFGGAIYQIIMRIIDALMAFPMLMLALLVAALLGGGIKNVVIALAIGMISAPTRMMCGVVMSGKQNDYILAARSMGVSNLRIMLKHILPNAFQPLLVMFTVGLGATILTEAGLSFLGVGVQPPTAAWGSMVNEGYKYLLNHPELCLGPGVPIMLVVFGFNMVGDGLRDALDPRLRGLL